MATQVEIRLPELADTMTSATLTAWLKKPGDPVAAGEPIAEVETDKTTVELEAPADGVLADIRVQAGAEAVAVGTVLALVRAGAAGDAGIRTPARDTVTTSVPPRPAETAPAPGPTPPTSGTVTAPDPTSPAVTAPAPESGTGGTFPPAAGAARAAGDSPATAAPAPARTDVPATALARRMAELAGIDLARVAGSGDGGRIRKVDVERLLGASPPAGAVATPAEQSHADRRPTAMRRVTAERMAESKRSAPHFYLEIECAVDRLLALRAAAGVSAGAAGASDGAGAPTVNDVVVRAAALALRAVPQANSAWTGEALRVYDRIDLAVAVSTPEGLVTPVVRAADTKPLAQIAAELRRLAADARAGRLQPADYQGGTCTISNLGMYGVSSLYAILNPPQSCILGVGAIAERPVVRDGAVTAGALMAVTLSADHRAIDGAAGAELLRAFRTLMEDPQRVYG